MVYDLTRACGWRWGGGKQGCGVGVSLIIGVDGGGRALGVRDAVGTDHGGSSTFTVSTVELKVTFPATVATVDVFCSRVRGFLRWSGGGRGRAGVGRSGGWVVATETVYFCLEDSDLAILGFFSFLEGSDEFGFGFGGVGSVGVLHGHNGETVGTRRF